MTEHHILAGHLKLALVTRRMRGVARFAAMSDGAITGSCNLRSGRYRIPTPPLLSPMERGLIRAVIERTRLIHGLPEVRRTWSQGLRALRAANESTVMP